MGMTLLSENEIGKFRNQVRYGRPSKRAGETVRAGIVLSQRLAEDGFIVLKLPDSPSERKR